MVYFILSHPVQGGPKK